MLHLLTDNWGLKLVSLAFSVVLWFFVIGERNFEVSHTVPLELKNVPKGMVVANEVPATVDIRLNGPRALLLNLSAREIGISVDLDGLRPGVTTFRRLEEHLNLPAGIRVTRLSPAYVDVKLEQIETKKIGVRPLLSGRPASGFSVVGIEVSPELVPIEGAAGELADIFEVATERIDIDGLSNSFELSVPLNYRGKYSQLKDRQAVEVYVRIAASNGREAADKPGRGNKR